MVATKSYNISRYLSYCFDGRAIVDRGAYIDLDPIDEVCTRLRHPISIQSMSIVYVVFSCSYQSFIILNFQKGMFLDTIRSSYGMHQSRLFTRHLQCCRLRPSWSPTCSPNRHREDRLPLTILSFLPWHASTWPLFCVPVAS